MKDCSGERAGIFEIAVHESVGGTVDKRENGWGGISGSILGER